MDSVITVPLAFFPGTLSICSENLAFFIQARLTDRTGRNPWRGRHLSELCRKAFHYADPGRCSSAAENRSDAGDGLPSLLVYKPDPDLATGLRDQD